MNSKCAEVQKTAALAYIILIMTLMPVYMRDGMNLIGDAKYVFYRNISLIFIAVWLVGTIVYCIIRYVNSGAEGFKTTLYKGKDSLHACDICLLCFLAATVLSFLFSSYKDTAFLGYSGWYMGLLTQFMIVWGYFYAKHWFGGEKAVWYGILISVSAVCVIGLLNRMEYDPLYVFPNIFRWDWNRRNLISTIGNINWFCSYLAVMLPAILYFFWSGKGVLRVFAGAASFVGMGIIILQGSSSGYIALGAMLAVLLFASLCDIRRMLRFLEILMLIPIFWMLLTILDVDLLLPEDVPDNFHGHMSMWICVVMILVILYAVLFILLKKNPGIESEKIAARIAKAVKITVAVMVISGTGIFILCQISYDFWQKVGGYDILKLSYEWGGMRGGLWFETLKGFAHSSFTQKLFGVGPDCYARYFYEDYALNVWSVGMWEDAIYANAHNEWLTMLVNEGVLGAAAYLGFFISSVVGFIKKYKTDSKENSIAVLGIMSITAYAANNFFSFGQVVSTPLVFLIAALCGNELCRNNAAQ